MDDESASRTETLRISIDRTKIVIIFISICQWIQSSYGKHIEDDEYLSSRRPALINQLWSMVNLMLIVRILNTIETKLQRTVSCADTVFEL